MLQRMGATAAAFAQRFVPHPFVFALILTLVTYLAGIVVLGRGPVEMIEHWQGGFWGFLKFGMQMCLILVTGYALASSRPIRRIVDVLAGLPQSTRSAAALTALVAMLLGLVNWGLGLIVGAYLAREIGRVSGERGRGLNYPLVAAAGYMGLVIWHGGLSGTAPLTVSTGGHFLEEAIGLVPISRTLLSPVNVVVSLGLLAVVTGTFFFLAPKREPTPLERAGESGISTDRGEADSGSPAARLENTSFFAWIFFAFAGIYLIGHFLRKGIWGIDLDTVNFFFLFLGFLLHGSAVSYVKAIDEAVRGISGIVLQFPFYAGIMGMMSGSGLIVEVAGSFVSLAQSAAKVGISTDVSLPVLTFFSAGFVNLFVPSGGGQWGVQGPIVVESASNLGASLPKSIMALAYGDEWTNMLQPFWALALLGITGLKAKDILGYTLIVSILVVPVYVIPLILF